MARPEDMLFLFVEAASGTDKKNLAEDDKSSQVIELAPAAGVVWELNRAIFTMQAGGSITAVKWGSGTALSNGLTFKIKDTAGATLLDLLDGVPIKSNGDIGQVCYDVNGFGNVNPSSDDYLHARWTFAKAGASITLQGKLGHKLVIGINDDLRGQSDTSVSLFRIQVQGVKKISNVP